MPFGFGRKKDASSEGTGAGAIVAAADVQAPRSVTFRGYTEDWRLEGQMHLAGRLLDTLNRRDAIAISDVRWAPADGTSDLEPAPGIQSMDPYDLIVVIAGPDTLAFMNEDERAAHRIHKVSFDVAFEAPPYRIVGTIHLHPGSEPDAVLDRATNMFSAVTDPDLFIGGQSIDLGGADTVLINRFYLRAVNQVDRATGEPHLRMPGQSMGGTNWTDRS